SRVLGPLARLGGRAGHRLPGLLHRLRAGVGALLLAMLSRAVPAVAFACVRHDPCLPRKEPSRSHAMAVPRPLWHFAWRVGPSGSRVRESDLATTVPGGLLVDGRGCYGGAVLAHARSTSATLQACAMQPRGVNGGSASKTSLIDPMHASARCCWNPSRNRRAPTRS